MPIRQPIVIGIILIATLVLFAVTSFRQEAQSSKAQRQQEDATVVQRGQVTAKEREYSKEYKNLYPDHNGRKLSEISEMGKRRGNTQEAGVSIGVPTVPTIGNSPLINASNFLKDLSCKADAIVLGSVKSKSAHLTEDETFVYTEYEFSVEDVLKNNSLSPVEINNNVQVTRPGGLIKLDNQMIRVEDKSYEPLQIKKRYLLFLRFVPSANGYIVSDVKGDFLLENDSVKKLSKFVLPDELESNKDSQMLLSNVRSSVLTRCEQKLAGGN